MKNRIKHTREFQASTKSLSDIRKFFSDSVKDAPLHPDLLDQLVLAVDEAATNVIKHSLDLNGSLQFKLEVELESNRIIVRLLDNGAAFDPHKIPVPDIEESIHKKKRGGLGIYLMRQIMDDVRYYRNRGTNVTELVKYF